MNEVDQFIAQGNTFREQTQPWEALACYANAFIRDPNHAGAWCNYGNVMRELGYPERSIPFLQHAAILDPSLTTTHFNLAVAYLLMGDYEKGWAQYEHRWNYEHLAGTLPTYGKPRWTGQDLRGKTILAFGEQGHGDIIMFSRYIQNLKDLGADVYFYVTDGLVPLFYGSSLLKRVSGYVDPDFEFDYWVPLMSIPGILGVTLDNMSKQLGYLTASGKMTNQWRDRLGAKTKLRIGFSWSGRPDTWIHRHKSVPFELMFDLVRAHPEYEWISLQVDATDEQQEQLKSIGLKTFPGAIHSFADTAALMMNLDLVLSMDTAISHLAGALARPTWVLVNNFAQDWRWLLNRDDSPWYPSAKLFRQPAIGDWGSALKKVEWHLEHFKI